MARSFLSRFLLGLPIGAALFLGGWLALVWGQLGVTSYGAAAIDAHYAPKLKRAAGIDGQKIVIVGGSSAMFALRSPRLEEAYGRPVVNLGVNAGLTLPTVLEKAKPAIGRGDIVLLPLEYPMFTYDGGVNQVFIDYILSHPGLFLDQPLDKQLRVLSRVTLHRLLQVYKEAPDGYGYHRPLKLDRWGDMTQTAETDRTEAQFQAVKRAPPETYGRDAPVRPKAWDVLRAFRTWTAEREACLIFIPPAFKAETAYRDDPVERAFYRTLPSVVRSHGLTYVGRPFDFMLPERRFFDTNYHPVAAARRDYTRRIVGALGEDLRPHCAAVTGRVAGNTEPPSVTRRPAGPPAGRRG